MVNAAHEKKTLRKILEAFTFEDFCRMSVDWLKTGRSVWFVHGNLDKSQAISLVEKSRSLLQLRPVHKDDLVDVRCIALPPHKNYLVEIPLVDTTNDNNCLLSYFEYGPEGTDLKTKMMHDVVMQYLDEPTFNQLRTVEQLGYVVFSRKTEYRDVMCSQFIIQSAKESCESILHSLNNHLANMREKVKGISEEEFKTQVEAVMIKVAEKDYNLGSEHSRYWSEISSHKYLFDR